MAVVAALYVVWLSTVAAQVEQTAAQETAATEAYEITFSKTVPSPLILVNRNRLMSLVVNNALGQNTPAIAAVEGMKPECGPRTQPAMYDYAGSLVTTYPVDPVYSAAANPGVAA
ncbi:PPE domain-containing protein [Mycobacterium lepromatosis]